MLINVSQKNWSGHEKIGLDAQREFFHIVALGASENSVMPLRHPFSDGQVF